MKEYFIGDGMFRVNLRILETKGFGLCCFVTGGSLSHVGGVAAGYPHDGSYRIESISLPTHKDAILAKQMAERLCIATGQAVTVTAGLHIDHAEKEDIDLLCSNAMEAVETYLQQLSSE